MIDEITQEKLVERIVYKTELLNEYILKEIGRQIKAIGQLSPSKAYQVNRLLEYGEGLNNIINKISEVTELNVQEIYEIFEEEAKINQAFAEKFYKAKGIEFIPFEQNELLQKQVNAIATLTAQRYVNLSNTLAFATQDVYGNYLYNSIARTYQDTIDKAILSISQGKETFYKEMQSTIKELGESGIRSVDYASGYSRRLDSAVRMNIQDGIKQLTNTLQEQFGEEFGADGVEITVHNNPAPDHADIQGRQFSKEQFNNLQNGIKAIDYTGKIIEPIEDGHERRPISYYNCYHHIFSIVLGISKPIYTEKQLKTINENNINGFMFDGKQYTNYQGTQLQRRIETEIRMNKNVLAIAKTSGDNDLSLRCSQRNRLLSKKYKELSLVSGLPTKMERLRNITMQ